MSAEPLQIKKYPNRRFYDATNSRHITLGDLRDEILAGREIRVTDSRSGEDLTNAILTQIILEKDPLKLGVFPPAILHQIIRTQHQHLGGVFEQWLRQSIEAQRASQEQWAKFLRNTMGGAPTDWTKSWMEAFMPRSVRPPNEHEAAPKQTKSAPADASVAESEIDELRRQLAELTKKVAELGR
ncbi:MAG: hypothetical protein KDA32_01815 [Phycisphaerales bacterium]|nr:hypothetical protein [Phycisphaerales bacterium]